MAATASARQQAVFTIILGNHADVKSYCFHQYCCFVALLARFTPTAWIRVSDASVVLFPFVVNLAQRIRHLIYL